jgi:hypothetical protein
MEKLNKQKLKCDGYQFHQYQQSEQSPGILNLHELMSK